MKRSVFTFFLAGAVSMFAATAQAGTFEIDLGYTFSGFVPGSTAPYLTAIFRDGADCVNSSGVPGGTATCAANTVQVTLTASLESAGEFVTEWDFNSTAAITIAKQSTGPSSGTYTDPTIDTYNSNHYQADGDGLYDFGFMFATPSAGRFDGTDQITFLLSGTGINAQTFNSLSAPAGGSGPFLSAAHIQGIQPNNCSGWVSDGNGATGAAPGTASCGSIAVPDSGTTVGLLGLAMLGLGILRRRLA
jgi:hypothetical protein